MNISKKETARIAELSRLKLSEKEREQFSKELSSILDYIEKLKKVKLNKEKPLYQTADLKNRLREDKVEPFLEKEEIIKQAPRKSEDFIEINKIFE